MSHVLIQLVLTVAKTGLKSHTESKAINTNVIQIGMPMTKHVFLSFVEEDLPSVVLFRGQAKNKNSALNFDDYSVKVPYNSTNADYIKTQIAAKIRTASATIVIIGATTSTSAWVKWEIEKSVALGNKVIGVKLSTAGSTPSALVAAGAAIIGWDIVEIVAELG